MDLGTDRSTVDALSWRLASELYRRHPDQLVLNRGHPGGGMYDCLMMFSRRNRPGAILLNRVGTIQVHDRFDGAGPSDWRPCGWEDYLRADPYTFLLALEDAAGLPRPDRTPRSTTATLVYRLFATLTALASKTRHPYNIEQAFIDSSGDDAGPNEAIEQFPLAARQLNDERTTPQPIGEPGLGYWMVFRDRHPLWTFHRDSGAVWTPEEQAGPSLTSIYDKAGRNIDGMALTLLEYRQR